MRFAFFLAKRDFQAYFNSPTAFVVLGVFLLFSGYLFFSTLFLDGVASMRGFFQVAPLLLMIFSPAITMKLISEEIKTGTIEQLLTLPITNTEVVVGKFFAALSIFLVGFLFTIVYAVSISLLLPKVASFDFGVVLGGYMGLVFLAGSFISLGLFASSLSKNQVIAFIIGLALCFFFYAVDKFAVLMPKFSGLLMYLSVDVHFNNVAKGILDSQDVVFYLSLMVFFLLLTIRSLAKAGR